MSSLIDENRLSGLKPRCWDEFKFKMKTWGEIDKNNTEEYINYAGEDAVGTAALYELYKPKIIEENLVLAYIMEKKASYMVLMMEWNGLGYDHDRAIKLKALCKKMMQEKENAIFTQAGYIFDLAATKKLIHFVYNDLNIVCRDEWRTGKTKEPSTSKTTIQKICIAMGAKDPRVPILEDVMAWSSYRKLYNSFFDSLEEAALSSPDGRIHASINQAVAVTGRFSVSDPALQQMPRDPLIKNNLDTHIRSAIVPAKGNVFVAADYSQGELIVTAHCGKDKKMIHAYNNGINYHLYVADLLKISKTEAKIVNFGLLNGMSPPTLAFHLRAPVAQAQKFITQYYQLFPGITDLRNNIVQHVRTHGYVRILNGRKRRLSPKASTRDIESFGGSAVIQGGLQIIIKMAMIKIMDRYKDREEIKPVLQIHDELVFECPEEIKEEVAQGVQYEMENALKLDVPLTAEPKTGNNLAECK